MFVEIDIGAYDHLLKCIDGPFSGRFIYISTAPRGEILGGSDPEGNSLTMFVENAELSPRHLEIKFS